MVAGVARSRIVGEPLYCDEEEQITSRPPTTPAVQAAAPAHTDAPSDASPSTGGSSSEARKHSAANCVPAALTPTRLRPKPGRPTILCIQKLWSNIFKKLWRKKIRIRRRVSRRCTNEGAPNDPPSESILRAFLQRKNATQAQEENGWCTLTRHYTR